MSWRLREERWCILFTAAAAEPNPPIVCVSNVGALDTILPYYQQYQPNNVYNKITLLFQFSNTSSRVIHRSTVNERGNTEFLYISSKYIITITIPKREYS